MLLFFLLLLFLFILTLIYSPTAPSKTQTSILSFINYSSFPPPLLLLLCYWTLLLPCNTFLYLLFYFPLSISSFYTPPSLSPSPPFCPVSYLLLLLYNSPTLLFFPLPPSFPLPFLFSILPPSSPPPSFFSTLLSSSPPPSFYSTLPLLSRHPFSPPPSFFSPALLLLPCSPSSPPALLLFPSLPPPGLCLICQPCVY